MSCNLNKHICITYIISNIWCIKYHKLSIYTSYQIYLIYIMCIAVSLVLYLTFQPLLAQKAPKSPRTQLSTSSHSPPRPRRLFDASSAFVVTRPRPLLVESHPFFEVNCRFHQRFLGFWRISIWMFPNTPK